MLQDICVTRRGEYRRNGTTYSDGNQAHLLHSEDGFEAIVDIMPKGTVGCLYTTDGEDFEFNYILRGRMELMGLEQKLLLGPGDTYTYHSLRCNYMFRVLEDVESLCIKKEPYYHQYEEQVDHLNEILNRLQAVDGNTLDHCTRVKELSLGIAYFLKFDQTQLLNLFYAAKFHDVGKSKVPPEILLKPGRLTPQEYEVMKQHSRYTYELIRDYYGEDVARLAFDHHERLDGNGYPQGLAGDEISLGARILCVADAYDAMTVTRPYHTALAPTAALAELRRCQGTQFDGAVIDALEEYLAGQ